MTHREEVEIFYRGLAMLGLLMQGCEYDNVPEFAKDLAERMMETKKPEGIAAITPVAPRRKNAKK